MLRGAVGAGNDTGMKHVNDRQLTPRKPPRRLRRKWGMNGMYLVGRYSSHYKVRGTK